MSAEDFICERAFFFLHFENFFLDGVLHDELVYGDRLCLTDAVRAICCLILRGKIPPWVKMDHNIRARQVQPCSARFQ